MKPKQKKNENAESYNDKKGEPIMLLCDEQQHAMLTIETRGRLSEVLFAARKNCFLLMRKKKLNK